MSAERIRVARPDADGDWSVMGRDAEAGDFTEAGWEVAEFQRLPERKVLDPAARHLATRFTPDAVADLALRQHDLRERFLATLERIAQIDDGSPAVAIARSCLVEAGRGTG